MTPRAERVRRPLSPEQTAGWLRFLRHADKAARNPAKHGAAFGRAATRAGRFQLPPGVHTSGSDLIGLIGLGKRFGAMKAEARAEAAADIARLVVAVRPMFEPAPIPAPIPAQVEGPAEAAPVRQAEPRRDIFG